jgi:4,5-dihydroxyphthalate decarboxylase
MADLALSIAVGDYDRVRPLMDGTVLIDGVDPVFMRLSPEEIFFRAMRRAEFDVCELSLSSFCLRTARGDNPYVGIPVFPSRAFRHTAIFIRTDRGIARPEDLRGRRIGLPEYQLTANVWARAILADDHGVQPGDITWVRAGLTDPGRVEKVAVALPPTIRLEDAPAHRTLSDMLDDGEIDGVIAPRSPRGFERGDPRIGWLFADPIAAGQDYFRRTGIFPIMHLLGLRRTLAEAHPWLPAALLKAFDASKHLAMERLADESAAKVTLPFVEVQVRNARALMGADYWPYGLDPNRTVLDAFLRHHHAQGLSSHRLAADALFHPGTTETFKV